MSIFNGDKIKVEIYGESHAEKIGVKCDNFPLFNIDKEKLQAFLDRRKPSGGVFSTQRKEDDAVVFESGISDENYVLDGSFEAVIYNKNQKSSDYNELYGKPRPSHADYCSYVKNGTLDYKGGGRFSGRLTAPMCIAGGIAKQYLEKQGVRIYAYLSQVGSVNGKTYKDGITEDELINNITQFPAISNQEEMLSQIETARKNGDSVGAKIECVVFGLNAGYGDCLFDGLEGKISSVVFGVPAVKGIEFGLGFDFITEFGSNVNDEFYFDSDKKVKTYTNNSGGINGGISNGMPITIGVAMKPTPSIFKPQRTIDLINKENVEITIKGRHDSCVAVRAVPVIEGAIALAILDSII